MIENIVCINLLQCPYYIKKINILKEKNLYKKKNCKDQIWIPSPKNGWTQAQKAQNNEFVENKLENWVNMSWTTNKVGSNDKNRKID